MLIVARPSHFRTTVLPLSTRSFHLLDPIKINSTLQESPPMKRMSYSLFDIVQL